MTWHWAGVLPPEDFKGHPRTVTSLGTALRYGYGVWPMYKAWRGCLRSFLLEVMRPTESNECSAYKGH